jgi:hypothetical protein
VLRDVPASCPPLFRRQSGRQRSGRQPAGVAECARGRALSALGRRAAKQASARAEEKRTDRADIREREEGADDGQLAEEVEDDGEEVAGSGAREVTQISTRWAQSATS